MSGKGQERDRVRPVISMPAVLLMLLLLVLCGSFCEIKAESRVGFQRVGTSAGVFLKIPIDARTAAMCGATTSLVSGPSAMFVNPAGLGLENERAAQVTCIQYTADIPMYGTAVSMPVSILRGSLGCSISGIYTEMDETDSYHPLGTGRSFSYSAWIAAVGFSRALTDKLSFGLNLKIFHESIGTEVGGPTLTPWMMDAGAIYYVGYRDSRIGIAMNNFGPDIRPSGHYESNRTGSDIRYGSFSPPTVFRFGFSIDPWATSFVKTLCSFEVAHLADSKESMRLAGEITFEDRIVLRSGYDFAADVLKFSCGAGMMVPLGAHDVTFDYSFTEGDDFGQIHRWTFTAPW